nr:unnamed protein product [Callosobruchus analis]
MKCTIKLTENKIYCSPECEAETNDSNEERQQADIKRLELEVIEKQAYIDRLQKRARDFENDVIVVKQKYIEEQHIYKAELKNNKEQMYLLRQKIIETEETNKNLTEKIEKYRQLFSSRCFCKAQYRIFSVNKKSVPTCNRHSLEKGP